MAGMLLLFGAVEIVKHLINRSRVEVLKEVKQVGMQILELRESLRGGSAPPS